MKTTSFKIAATLCVAMTSASFADEITLRSPIEVKVVAPVPPYIEYHNRMAVFDLSHVVYERIQTDAFYAGVELWAVPVYSSCSHGTALFDAELRFGYNFFWSGRDHFTPFAGGGFLQDIGRGVWCDCFDDSHHHKHHSKPGIAYGTVGFLYDHEFNTVFNLGFNAKLLMGGSVENSKHFKWGSPVVGVDVSLPITFRFGNKRHWDLRLEPFDMYLHSSHADCNYFGGRSTIGYRF